jgi:mRNA-degrading endonuclease RelE of RelBE toxin-antitoxin system
LRKLRFAPERWRRGKSGGIRVCYAYLEAYKIVILIIAYSKRAQDDLTPAERKAIKALLEKVEKQLHVQAIRSTRGPNQGQG